MKRWLVGMMLLCGAAMLLAGCGGKSKTPLTYIDLVHSTDLSQELNEKVRLGVSEQELVTQAGKPERTLNNGRIFMFMYENFQYSSLDNVVLAYSPGPKLATAKGVKLGSAREGVEKMYGNSFYTRGDAMGYIDKDKRLALEFAIKNDRVAAITLSSLKLYE
ncbi:hypothetical protein [Paenibacillus montanisoli]|uniref:Lipoprotein SmpA/OmlA domain-containing protein n=1 Tax=Paenibacillus montanisoli TaxID=2081970 RepID=A0A328TVV4_9BACL|nr:hypothetical protein [Paenibacillus montanisoli]RAP74627.1 hypothetical protein DL346_21475 [Paenibacillus montanisoli]